MIMDPAIEEMLARAVVAYLGGNYSLCHSWTYKAQEALKEKKERNRLHATVGEILEYKKKSINLRRTDYEQVI
jgi:hypothetical protein